VAAGGATAHCKPVASATSTTVASTINAGAEPLKGSVVEFGETPAPVYRTLTGGDESGMNLGTGPDKMA
jgi:hypothetical protein